LGATFSRPHPGLLPQEKVQKKSIVRPRGFEAAGIGTEKIRPGGLLKTPPKKIGIILMVILRYFRLSMVLPLSDGLLGTASGLSFGGAPSNENPTPTPHRPGIFSANP
jgi:hypothetical protein